MHTTVKMLMLWILAIAPGCALFLREKEIHDVSSYSGSAECVVLLPQSQIQPVHVAPHARTVGKMTVGDWKDIVTLIGRLPGLTEEARTIQWVWCEGTPVTVIRIALGDPGPYMEVTFTRARGRWHLAEFGRLTTDR